METKNSFLSAGDNRAGNLFINGIKFSSKFIESDRIPFDANLLQISAYANSFSCLHRDMTIYYKSEIDDWKKFNKGLVTKVACCSNQLFCLERNGTLWDILSNQKYKGNYRQFSLAKNYLAAIDLNNNLFVFRSPESRKQIAENVIAVGCTDEVIFYSDNTQLYCYDPESEEKVTLDVSSPIVLIATSDTEAIFADKNGCLYQYIDPVVVQVFGVPPVVQIDAGPQHFCAIGNDGNLYTWGFNPSGQLGIGNDRSSNEPILVKENVFLATCGTFNTYCVTGHFPEVPMGMNVKMNNPKIQVHNPKRIFRSEYLY